MTQTTVGLQIRFQSLVDAIASLGVDEKRRLWEILESEIGQLTVGADQIELSEGEKKSVAYSSCNQSS